MNKKNLTNLEMIYIMYCKTLLRYPLDPLCVIIAIYIVDNPLDSPFLVGFVYFSVYIITRLPMMLYYHDV